MFMHYFLPFSVFSQFINGIISFLHFSICHKESEDNSELNGRSFVMMRAIWRKFHKNDIALRFEF